MNPASVQPVEVVAARLLTRPILQEYDAFTVELVLNPAEFGNLAVSHNLLEIAEACRREVDAWHKETLGCWLGPSCRRRLSQVRPQKFNLLYVVPRSYGQHQRPLVAMRIWPFRCPEIPLGIVHSFCERSDHRQSGHSKSQGL